MTENVPGSLNLAILAITSCALAGFLWGASHSSHLGLTLLCAVGFSFLGNTMYSLMHEAVHKHFHKRKLVNEAAGRICAAFFPTAFSLQRVFHLAHHRNNRSERERFDYYAPEDNRAIKYVQWYCILTGLYWMLSPLFCLLYFFTAELIKWSSLFTKKARRFGKQTSAQAFLDSLAPVPIWQARIDIILSVVFQIGLIMVLDITLFGWLICYAAFALNWSSLQYADHAFSELDEKEGAWNLKVSKFSKWVFLNYHYHLAHHRDPALSWHELPAHVKSEDPNPSFWSIYWQMWRGPRAIKIHPSSGIAE